MKKVLSVFLALALAIGIAAAGTVGASAAWTDAQWNLYCKESAKISVPIDLWSDTLPEMLPGKTEADGTEPPYSWDILHSYDLVGEHFATPAEAIVATKATYAWALTMFIEFYGVVAPAELWALCDATPPGTPATTYTLTYNANGGTGGPAQQAGIAKGATVTLSTTAPTRAGYTFKGWAATSTGTTLITSVAVSANTTVYAVWEKDTVTPEPGADPIFGLLASFLPVSVANVAAAIVRYVFFGWLWGRWL